MWWIRIRYLNKTKWSLCIDRRWTPEIVLSKEAMFFLKDIAPILSLDSRMVVRLAQKITKDGGNPHTTMGMRKTWNQWSVRVIVFAPYYRSNFPPTVRSVEPEWTGNQLLAQKGLFYLTLFAKKSPSKPIKSGTRSGAKPFLWANAGPFKMKLWGAGCSDGSFFGLDWDCLAVISFNDVCSRWNPRLITQNSRINKNHCG